MRLGRSATGTRGPGSPAAAQGQCLLICIRRRGPTGFEPAKSDPESYQPSALFACRFRLEGRRDKRGHWAFDLLVREKP